MPTDLQKATWLHSRLYHQHRFRDAEKYWYLRELNGIGFSWLRDVVKTLSGMATDCEAINEEVATRFKATPDLYYRFNVEQGLQEVEMDKHEKLNIVTAKTEGYLSKDVQQEKLVQAAKKLASSDMGPCLVTELVPMVRNLSGSVQYDTERVELNEHPPFPISFFGRQEFLEQLHATLDPQSSGPRRMILWGFPGSGKTAITLRYLQLHGQQYTESIWINAKSKETMQESLREVVEELAPEQASRASAKPHLLMTKWLQRNRKPWLLIVDSFDDNQEIDLARMIPKCTHGSILITSRHPKPENVNDFVEGEVTQLHGTAATDLLCSKLGTSLLSGRALTRAVSIVTALHGLPLALEQAGIALKYGCSFEELENIVHDEANLSLVLNDKPRRNDWTYDKNQTIYAVLEDLYVRLGQENATAPHVMAWIALLGPGEVPRNALMPFTTKSHQRMSTCGFSFKLFPETVALPAAFANIEALISQPSSFWRVVGTLEDFCLLKARRSSHNEIVNVSLHNTVRQWIITRMSHVDLEALILFSISVLSLNFNSTRGHGPKFLLQRALRLPARNIVAVFSRNIQSETHSKDTITSLSTCHTTLHHFARHLITMQLYKEAQRILQGIIASKLTLEQDWPTDENALCILEQQTDCLFAIGFLDDARAAYADLLEQCTKILGHVEPMTLRITHKLRETIQRLSQSYTGTTHFVKRPVEQVSLEGTAHQGSDHEETHSSLSNWLRKKIPCEIATQDDHEFHRLICSPADHLPSENQKQLSDLQLDPYKRGDYWRAAAYSTAQWTFHDEFEDIALRYCACTDSAFILDTDYRDTVFNALLELFEALPETTSNLNTFYLVCIHRDAKLFDLLLQDADLSTRSLVKLIAHVSLMEPSSGHAIILMSLIRATSVQEIPRYYVNNFFEYALNEGQEDIAILLLEQGASPDASGWFSGSEFFGESIHCDLEKLVRFMISKNLHSDYVPHSDYAKARLSNTLRRLAEKNKASFVDCLLGQNFCLSGPYGTVHTWLTRACRRGDIEMAQFWLDREVDANAANSEGWTPLICAAKGGHVAVVKLLLDRGADIHAGDNEGSTALMIASWYGIHQVVELLLDYGADINGADDKGVTALMFASDDGSYEVVKTLLHRGSDLEMKCRSGNTALHYARIKRRYDIIELFLRFDAALSRTANLTNEKLLIQASKHGHCSLVKLLLDRGADMTATDCFGATPLINSLIKDHFNISVVLLSRRAKLRDEVEHYQRCQLLCHESLNGSPLAVRTLLDQGANANSMDKLRRYPALALAAYRGCVTSVVTLLAKGADPDLQYNNRWTALALAVAQLPTDYVETQAGQRSVESLTSLKTWESESSVDLESSHQPMPVPNHKEVIRLLVEAGSDPDAKDQWGKTGLWSAVVNGDPISVGCWLRCGADPNFRVKRQNSMVAQAMKSQHHTIVESLLDHGAEGVTRLTYHSMMGHVDQVASLLDKGTDPNAKGEGGYTALMCALQSEDNYLEITRLLLDNGADPDISCDDEETLVEMALADGRLDVVRLLEERGFVPPFLDTQQQVDR